MVNKYEPRIKTISVKPDQHETIVGMKRGKDTIYDVVDRLIDTNIANDDAITGLESQFEDLEKAVFDMSELVHELKWEMNKCLKES
jgi:predicted CopG family antitoxin